MSFIPIDTIIDDVPLNNIVNVRSITYIEQWLGAGGQPDPGIIKIYRYDTDALLRVRMSISDFADRYGHGKFLKCDCWTMRMGDFANGQSKPERTLEQPRIFNPDNISSFRPYTMQSKIDHYVIYVPRYGAAKAQEFHLSQTEAMKVEQRLLGL